MPSWFSARHLVDFCESEADEIGLLRDGATVLELGAGCGFLGMMIARNVPSLKTCLLTEMETGGALEHLQHNVDLNHDLLEGRATTSACDWVTFGQPGSDPDSTDPVAAEHWDIIVASDLVYDEAGVEMLPRVLGRLICGGTVCFYCHTLHRYDMMDADFLQALKAEDLVVTEVRRRSEATPPPSPPPFECLFNEHRLVIWRITRAEAAAS